MVHQEVQKAAEKGRIGARPAQRVRRQSRQSEEARHQIGFTGKPAKNVDRDILGGPKLIQIILF